MGLSPSVPFHESGRLAPDRVYGPHGPAEHLVDPACGSGDRLVPRPPRWPGKAVVETLVTLPLVLPPVVTGLALLKLFGRRGPLGRWIHELFGIDVIFTWRAVVIALGVMALPLLVRAARAAFEEVDQRFEQIARTLGASEWRIFFTISLPLARRGVLGGTLLAFARALGEFGATIMVAGNILAKPRRSPSLCTNVSSWARIARLGCWPRSQPAWLFWRVLVSEFLLKRGKP